jgi:hypothetical protein
MNNGHFSTDIILRSTQAPGDDQERLIPRGAIPMDAGQCFNRVPYQALKVIVEASR